MNTTLNTILAFLAANQLFVSQVGFSTAYIAACTIPNAFTTRIADACEGRWITVLALFFPSETGKLASSASNVPPGTRRKGILGIFS